MPSSEALRILVLEDDLALSRVLVESLQGIGNEVSPAGRLADARELLRARLYDVALLDLQLPDGSGLELLREIATAELPTEAIVLTGNAEVPTAIEAMRLGAYDYLAKPARLDELELLVAKAGEKARLRRDNAALRLRLLRHEPVRGLVTNDPGMKRLLETLERAAASDLPVLIQGESGTGKELLARAVHERSPRGEFPFVPINCAALPENLVESELFGHERGAFTGAADRKLGLVELASRGTLLLDEIGELATELQAKLLRVIETREFFRVGGTRAVHADVRVVSATNKDLLEAIGSGRFREDLYYRLNGVTLALPPLRERRGDIELLARHFLDRIGGGRMLSRAALEALRRYDWPGNVRELEMVIRRSALLAPGTTLEPADLPLDVRPATRSSRDRASLTLEEMEREHVLSVLRQQGGHRARTAKVLGIDPKTLYNKLRSWGHAAE